jgi:hypothetical protein
MDRCATARLDASVEASGPHDFAVRFSAVRQRHLHVHRIPPRVRDDREPPLWVGQDGLVCSEDLPDGLSEILPVGLFCRSPPAASGQMQFARGDEFPRFGDWDRTMGLLMSVDPHDLAGHQRITAALQKDGQFEHEA